MGTERQNLILSAFSPEFSDLSTSVLNKVVNETVLLGGDFNCALKDGDKRGGRSFESKAVVIIHVVIQCRLDYFFSVSKYTFDYRMSDSSQHLRSFGTTAVYKPQRKRNKARRRVLEI